MFSMYQVGEIEEFGIGSKKLSTVLQIQQNWTEDVLLLAIN